MRAARMKAPSIVLTIVGAALVLLSWSQTWFDVRLAADVASSASQLQVAGDVASPALAAFALAAFALAGALAIAGPVIRLLLGVLDLALAGCIALATSISLGDPGAAASPAVTEVTGVAGAVSTARLIESNSATFWPSISIVGALLVGAAAVLVLVTGSRWNRASSRFRAARFDHVADAPTGATSAPTSAEATADHAVDAWDELSRGDDPTGTSGDDHPSR